MRWASTATGAAAVGTSAAVHAAAAIIAFWYLDAHPTTDGSGRTPLRAPAEFHPLEPPTPPPDPPPSPAEDLIRPGDPSSPTDSPAWIPSSLDRLLQGIKGEFEQAALTPSPGIPTPPDPADAPPLAEPLAAQPADPAPPHTTSSHVPAAPQPPLPPGASPLTHPNPAPAPTQQPHPATPGNPAEAPAPGDPAEPSDRESDAAAIRDAVEYRAGRVDAGRGLDIRTVRPVFSKLARVTALPQNPIIELRFDRSGKVKSARILHSSGYARDADEPVLNALWAWRAKGKPIDDLAHRDPDATVRLVVKVILR